MLWKKALFLLGETKITTWPSEPNKNINEFLFKFAINLFNYLLNFKTHTATLLLRNQPVFLIISRIICFGWNYPTEKHNDGRL